MASDLSAAKNPFPRGKRCARDVAVTTDGLTRQILGMSNPSQMGGLPQFVKSFVRAVAAVSAEYLPEFVGSTAIRLRKMECAVVTLFEAGSVYGRSQSDYVGHCGNCKGESRLFGVRDADGHPSHRLGQSMHFLKHNQKVYCNASCNCRGE